MKNKRLKTLSNKQILARPPRRSYRSGSPIWDQIRYLRTLPPIVPPAVAVALEQMLDHFREDYRGKVDELALDILRGSKV